MTVAMPRRPVEDMAAADAGWGDAPAPVQRVGRAVGGLVVIFIVGYLALGKSFSYLGLASADIFIGEVALIVLVAHPVTRSIFTEAVRSLFDLSRFSALNTAISLLLIFGVSQFVRGVHEGFNPLIALQNVPFDYYPLFVLVGVWAASRNPGLLPRATFWLAVVNGTYGALYVITLSHSTAALPTDPGVSLFTTGSGSGIALLGLAAYHRQHRWTPVLAALNLFVLLGNQQRSEWIALTIGLTLWAIGNRQVKLLAQGAATLMLALVALSLSGITLGGAGGRGGTISLGGIFGRLIAAVDPSFASKLTPDSAGFAGTASWRSQWWHDIWVSSQSSAPLSVIGHGYGYPLHALTNYVPADTRTPHNVFFYALGYTGWFGVALLLLLWCCIMSLLFKRGRLDGDWFGLAVFCMVIAIGLLGNWFETPFGAIPSYLLVGMAMSPLASRAPQRRRALRAETISAHRGGSRQPRLA